MMTLRRAATGSLRKLSPLVYYSLLYRRAGPKVAASRGERDRLFAEFLSACQGSRGIQIAVKDEYGEKFGPKWVSVDKYDHQDCIDRHDDVESLGFPDASFDAAVCWSVLEHVPHPAKAIGELYRVLKPGGLIWVQLPFNFPYHQGPEDYWRVTPSGLRLWMSQFEETACACDYWARTSIISATYFVGRKPLVDSVLERDRRTA